MLSGRKVTRWGAAGRVLPPPGVMWLLAVLPLQMGMGAVLVWRAQVALAWKRAMPATLPRMGVRFTIRLAGRIDEAAPV